VQLCDARPELASVKAAALINGAIAALHQKDFAKSYQHCREALASCSAPQTPDKQYERAAIEAIFVRVLLALKDVERAQEHATLARRFSHMSGLARAEISAETASGLAEIASNAKDIGLTRIKRMVELCRSKVQAQLRDTLGTAIVAYEAAGEPDVALFYLHELMAMNREAKEHQVVLRHHAYIAQLDHSGGGSESAVQEGLRLQQGKLRVQLRDSREQVRTRSLQVEREALAAERLDDTTGEHCFRVGRLASILGQQIGLEDDVCFLIDLAARLHDIGKLIVPDAILLKPGKLTPGERELMETHTVAGWEILGKTKIPQMHIAQEIARHHHERWNGQGYPDRLVGTAIPISARVAALADVFDALTHKRPYKEAWPIDQALNEIRNLRAVQFDPELTDVFLDLVPRLQQEHGDLDRFLAADAKTNPYIQARDKIAAALKGTDPNVSLFDLRR
jgi:putative two-component system response regulator